MENIDKIKIEQAITINRLACATLDGLKAKVIEVEATFTKGLPGFSVVGLASSDIQESKERVKSALLVNSFVFPPLKITVNLSPSDLKKSGTHFDLSLALLIALNKSHIDYDGLFVFGELGLDGRIKSSSMLFPLILSLKEQGLIDRAIVPMDSVEHLSYIAGVDFIGVESLTQAIEIVKNDKLDVGSKKFDYPAQSIEINNKIYYMNDTKKLDFADVKGQGVAKKASLVAAAGMHNFLMEGSPGCGKSMIAKRLQYLLPPIDEAEMLLIAKHQFLDGQIPSFDASRPMRSPHHTATSASIFGGGSNGAKIGEVALASSGMLFFDELPHFSKNILEALREPLQDGKVNIARVNAKTTYDAEIMFVGAMNPCPCGNLLSKKNSCRCSEIDVRRYQNRLSDPFLDRMDLFVVMQEVASSDKSDMTSKQMSEAILRAFTAQKDRNQPRLNGKLREEEIDLFCTLDNDANDILDSAMSRFALSHRSVSSIKKVARTIADINDNKNITKNDILEALSYRRRKINY